MASIITEVQYHEIHGPLPIHNTIDYISKVEILPNILYHLSTHRASIQSIVPTSTSTSPCPAYLRMAHLSPTAVFSPSIARQQLAAAKDWSYIDSWLSLKFAPRPAPPFERNATTLASLLALASLNQSADEERDMLFTVQSTAAQELAQKHEVDPHGEMLDAFEDALTREGKVALDALAEMSVALHQPVVDVERLAVKTLELQKRKCDLEQASARVELLQKHVTRELARLDSLILELKSGVYNAPADLSKQTLEYQRKTKVLATKLPELKDRLISLTAAAGGPPRPTIEEVRLEEDRFRELMEVVKSLEAQVKAYHGLPHDTDLARLEVEALKAELRDLSRRRDNMFEGLVERESPQKRRL